MMFNFKNNTKKLGLFPLTVLTFLLSSAPWTFAMDQTQQIFLSQESLPTLDGVKELINKAKAGDPQAQNICMRYRYNGAYQKLLTPETLGFFSWHDIENRCYNDDIYGYYAFNIPGITEKFLHLVTRIKERAGEGIPAARNNLGIMYFRGNMVEQNNKLAAFYYKCAAKQGFAAAQYNLALAYKKGTGVEINPEKALKYLERAAGQGFAPSQYELALLYRRINKQKMFYYLHLAAHQKFPFAQGDLGFAYWDIREDINAVSYFEQAAHRGDPCSQATLAWLNLRSGELVWAIKFAHMVIINPQSNAEKEKDEILSLFIPRWKVYHFPNGPQLGDSIINHLEFKRDFYSRALATVNTLQTQANSNIEQMIKESAHNPSASILNPTLLQEEFDFLNNMEAAIKSVDDPLKDALRSTVSFRTRATRARDQEEN